MPERAPPAGILKTSLARGPASAESSLKSLL